MYRVLFRETYMLFCSDDFSIAYPFNSKIFKIVMLNIWR